KSKTTPSLASAIRFADRKAVDNYCKSLPKSLKNLCYYPTFVQDEVEQDKDGAKPEVHSVTMASPAAVLDESILDSETFAAKIQDFQRFVISATQQRPLLVDAQMHAEAEIKDIEHAIEFYNYNAADGYKMFRRLKDARMRRRQYKDAIAWIDIFMESNPKPVAEANTVNRIRGMQHRQYAPAALPELFEKDRPVTLTV
ncbi:MAG: hypothetical protein ACI4TK_05775, partial [Agathobacter sp.]